MAYERPQVTVDQNITVQPNVAEREQPAFVFGPSYVLHRYSAPAEKPGTSIGLYEYGSTLEVEYPGVIDPSLVDKDYTKLFGDNVVIALAQLEDAGLPEANMQPNKLAVNGGYTMVIFSEKNYVDHDIDGMEVQRDEALAKNLAVGDSVQVDYTVDEVQSSFITKIASVKLSADDPWELDTDSSYEGPKGTLIVLEDAIPVRADTTSISVTLVDVKNGVEFTSKNESNGSGYQWTQENGKVQVENLNTIDYQYSKDPIKYYSVISADLYLTYRELDESYADQFHSVIGASGVPALFGAVDKDNPLAKGVEMAALNAATDDGDEAPPVYFMAVPFNRETGKLDWQAVLTKATLTDRAYVFAPVTKDPAIIELVENHVKSMSVKDVKMWRIGVVCEQIPSEVMRLGPALNDFGADYYAIPIVNPSSQAVDMLQVITNRYDDTPNADVRFRSTIRVGDVVKFNPHMNGWDEEVWDEYKVAAVLNNNTIQLKEDVDTTSNRVQGNTGNNGQTPVAGAAKIEIYHTYTPAEIAEVVAASSRQMASRRMYNVYPQNFLADGVSYGGEFAACAVAGLVSATEPQQPITNMAIRGIDDIPSIYQQHSKEELDVMAAGGTFIVAQDFPGDRVYVRHQISTAYSDGNLNTAELSITKNVDSISYAFSDAFAPYVGKYNIFPDFLATLRNVATTLIDEFAGSNSVYGPQLIAEETEIKYIRQNALEKDHVDIKIQLGVPYPCNNIDIVLTV